MVESNETRLRPDLLPNTQMIYIGIDPGLNGGIATIEAFIPTVQKTPVIAGKEYDIAAMRRILQKIIDSKMPVMAFIENQIAMPGQGLTSTLQTGKGFGIWIGLLAGLGVPYQIIGAQAWQRRLFTGVKATLDTKDKSEIIAKRLFPDVDFRKSERARVADDGLTDAILIAEYGRRIHKEVEDPVTGVPHVENPHNKLICVQCGAYLPTARENDCKQRPLFT